MILKKYYKKLQIKQRRRKIKTEKLDLIHRKKFVEAVSTNLTFMDFMYELIIAAIPEEGYTHNKRLVDMTFKECDEKIIKHEYKKILEEAGMKTEAENE
jgi:hypothetical protein